MASDTNDETPVPLSRVRSGFGANGAATVSGPSLMSTPTDPAALIVTRCGMMYPRLPDGIVYAPMWLFPYPRVADSIRMVAHVAPPPATRSVSVPWLFLASYVL